VYRVRVDNFLEYRGTQRQKFTAYLENDYRSIIRILFLLFSSQKFRPFFDVVWWGFAIEQITAGINKHRTIPAMGHLGKSWTT
jgi:hypothetical protein